MAYSVPDLAPGERHQAEDLIRRSRFIVSIARAGTPEEAKAFVESVRAEHARATHNCWAYVAGPPGDTARVGASDDGEPKGTAGRPMLAALLGSGVGDIVAVVTRYFGGILLGTGGLVHAYQGTVKLGLEGLPLCQKVPEARMLVSVEQSQSALFMRALGHAGGRILTSDLRFDAAYEVLVPERAAPAFEAEILRETSGSALVERLESGPED